MDHCLLPKTSSFPQHHRHRRRRFVFFSFFALTLLLALHNCSGESVSAKHARHHLQSLLRYDGEVNIGVLVNLHHPPARASPAEKKPINEIDAAEDVCGLINVDAVQQVIAAKWAVDVINNQSLPHELKIGIQLHDTCNEADLTQKHLFHVISTTREFDPLHKHSAAPSSALAAPPPLLGMIGVGDAGSLAKTSGALHAFNIPLISASPEHAENLGGEENVLTTAPDMSGQARAVASLVFEMDTKSVALISSSHKITQVFLAEATTMGIRVPRILDLDHLQPDQPQQVESFLRHLAGGNPTVVLLVNAHEAVAIAEHLQHEHLDTKPTWLIGSLGLDLKKQSGWRRVFHGGIFVEPHMPELQEFKKYFIESMQNPDDNIKSVIREYKEEMFGCTHSTTTESFLVHCDDVPSHEVEVRFQQDPYVSFVVKAVSALTAAFRLVQLDHCSENVKAACLRQVHEDLHDDILGNLRKLSFTSMVPHDTAMEVEGTQHHFTKGGRLVANKQEVFVVDNSLGLDMIGSYSEDEGLRLTESLAKFVTTELPVSSPLVKEEPRSTFARSISGDAPDTVGEADLNNIKVHHRPNSLLESRPTYSYESFISRTWALVVVSVAIFGFIVSLWMLLYVFQKICDGTLSGSQVMGVLLLIGVMCLFVSVVPWLLPPNEVVCAVRHFMHPLLLVVCFSILLVKSMQLRALVTIGLGGTIPLTNQLLSLVFMIIVQVVIAVEWFLATAPIGIQVTDGYPECGVSTTRFLLLHIYPVVLLLLSFFYGISVIKVRRNFNEGRWITCATIFIIPIFVAWPLVYYFAPVAFHDPSVAVSVLAVAGILLAAIFLPKMHTIAQQSQLKSSDLSRTHSDATVYTGFSDYVTFAGKPAGKAPMYPVYGYTTNQFVPPSRSPMGPSSPNKKISRNKPDGFTGMNYVCPPSGPNVKSYSDWSRDYSTQNLSQPHRHEAVSSSYSVVPRSKDSLRVLPLVKESAVDSNSSSKSSRRRGRSHSSTSRPVLPDPAGRVGGGGGRHGRPGWPLGVSTNLRRGRSRSSSPTYDYDYQSSLQRQRHSQSPSDGMILTAAGLTSMHAPPDGQNNQYHVSEVFLTH